VTALLFTPAWGYVAHEATEWRHFDLSDPRCEIDLALPGAGGRYLFVNGRCGGPTHAAILDLRTGAWRRVGLPRDGFRPVRDGATHAVVALDEMATRDGRGVWQHYYDGATAEEFKSGWSYMRHEEVLRRLARPVPDDGSRVEVRGRRIVRVRGDTEEQLFPR
jgi:hypothetical protein